MLGRGYVPIHDPPRVEWTCGSGVLSSDAEPTQSDKCIAIIFKEVEELRGEAQHITKQRDDLLWLLHAEFTVRHPVVTEPDWLTYAGTTREAADAAGGK
jgi:hypothetical protein